MDMGVEVEPGGRPDVRLQDHANLLEHQITG
jgi:hypothetical protein